MFYVFYPRCSAPYTSVHGYILGRVSIIYGKMVQSQQESQWWLSVFALGSCLCVLLCLYWCAARGEIQLHEIKRPILSEGKRAIKRQLYSEPMSEPFTW